ncbi:MAG: methylmalonyl-CoA epimerase [Elusimicrobia bacterium]|nr:methylmalonyl-CoA epimerase [Elusimicrobiota bacterium]
MVIDHVGVAVESIESALPFYRKALKLDVVHTEIVAPQKVKVAFLQAGPSFIELLEPTGPEGPVADFLKKRGPGIHHVAFSVKDLTGHIMRLTQEGLPPLDDKPRPGARGHHVCFLHPKFAQGVLVELVENNG